MGLYTSAVLGVSGISVPSGLILYAHVPDPISASGGPIPSGLILVISGNAATSEQLNLRIRGN